MSTLTASGTWPDDAVACQSLFCLTPSQCGGRAIMQRPRRTLSASSYAAPRSPLPPAYQPMAELIVGDKFEELTRGLRAQGSEQTQLSSPQSRSATDAARPRHRTANSFLLRRRRAEQGATGGCQHPSRSSDPAHWYLSHDTRHLPRLQGALHPKADSELWSAPPSLPQ